MKEFIQSLGFNESEAKMYLALLELGTAKVSKVTERAGLGRTLGYHIMDKLLEYGIVEEVKSPGSPIIHYVAKHPEHLAKHVSHEAIKWEETVNELKERLPEFIDVYTNEDRPVVRFYDNVAGLKKSMQRILDKRPNELLNIMNFSATVHNDEYQAFKQEFYDRRKEIGIKSRILMVDTWKNRKLFQDLSDRNDGWYEKENYRWITLDEMPAIVKQQKFGLINIYEDTTLISVFQKNKFFAIEIDNKPITNLVKLLFEYAWKQTAPTPKKKDV